MSEHENRSNGSVSVDALPNTSQEPVNGDAQAQVCTFHQFHPHLLKKLY